MNFVWNKGLMCPTELSLWQNQDWKRVKMVVRKPADGLWSLTCLVWYGEKQIFSYCKPFNKGAALASTLRPYIMVQECENIHIFEEIVKKKKKKKSKSITLNCV